MSTAAVTVAPPLTPALSVMVTDEEIADASDVSALAVELIRLSIEHALKTIKDPIEPSQLDAEILDSAFNQIYQARNYRVQVQPIREHDRRVTLLRAALAVAQAPRAAEIVRQKTRAITLEDA